MPQLDEQSERLLRAGHRAESSVKRFWDGFCDFALQDNILEVAVGLMCVLNHFRRAVLVDAPRGTRSCHS